MIQKIYFLNFVRNINYFRNIQSLAAGVRMVYSSNFINSFFVRSYEDSDSVQLRYYAAKRKTIMVGKLNRLPIKLSPRSLSFFGEVKEDRLRWWMSNYHCSSTLPVVRKHCYVTSFRGKLVHEVSCALELQDNKLRLALNGTWLSGLSKMNIFSGTVT